MYGTFLARHKYHPYPSMGCGINVPDTKKPTQGRLFCFKLVAPPRLELRELMTIMRGGDITDMKKPLKFL